MALPALWGQPPTLAMADRLAGKEAWPKQVPGQGADALTPLLSTQWDALAAPTALDHLSPALVCGGSSSCQSAMLGVPAAGGLSLL